MTHQDIRDGLNASMRDLEAAFAQRDKPVTWRQVGDTLEWLHKLEQAEKHSPDYWTDQAGHAAGQTLGGLLWALGIAHHHDEARQTTPEVLAHPYFRTGTGVVRKPVLTKRPGGCHPVPVRVVRHVWVTRSDLPSSDRSEDGGRELWYDQHVAGRPLLPPLQAAKAWITARR